MASLMRMAVAPSMWAAAPAVRVAALAVRGYAAEAGQAKADAPVVKVDIANCHDSLEWVVPSPPNFHTFDELPFIKESENE
ncbi:uncharacterized protein AMSG_00369 [Thecamonas trahens ATCC 50062]|uniref:Uncharacterized protein n=1 Tax=Thecamonas trahens ATCC 50062 TaxID=461836 RepID=A0A0L0D8A8_THETB|nr:hypothetical protein AMSG_00369 [Thecamonas trahens ATCC 50062]KNC48592.1 hypothetical protein AMSG_00369 [Thecamonas trahens ATCC 50062]|eukprot:XP_013762648.1 hypothetical protein AMSG_00369 [Thecamonas trahens ATCC 50062]